MVSEILTEARKLSRSIEGKDVMLRVHPDVAKVLKSHQNKFLEELEEMLRRPVLVDRKSTRLNSSHITRSRMPSSA